MTHNHPLLKTKDIFELLSKRFDDAFISLKDLPDPSVFKDMDRAIDRISKAITNKEKIIIIGDYDVDGVISTSIMKLFFEEIGYPIKWIIPNRFRDGYGLSTSLIPRIKDFDLVITVDNGISAVEAAKECKELEIDLIITDHHIVPDIIPEAYAIINQKQLECSFPYKEICGAQIAWYLCSAINRYLHLSVDMKSYLELVSIAIIADIMPLKHINRAMVKAGIKLLDQSSRAFMEAYKKYAKRVSLKSEDIAFSLAPLLNSAGRLEDASLAVEFICSKNRYDVKKYLDDLVSMNEQRKSLEQQIVNEVVEKTDHNSKVIVVSSEGWHEGVVGIVAARVARKFERPTIILSRDGEICKGSGRSFNKCDLFQLVNRQRDILEKFGGHSAAIGLSIRSDRLREFSNRLDADAQHLCSQDKFIDPDIIGMLSFKYIDFDLIDMISQFEPFGEGNAKPKFITKNVEILSAQSMGEESNHLKFVLRDDQVIQHGVQFKTYARYETGQIVDIIYSLNINHFREESTIQLMIDRIVIVG